MIDSSIYQGIKPVQIDSQANNLANILKLQELQQGGQLNALKLQEAQRGIEQQNNLRSILSGIAPNEDVASVASKLMRGGMLKEAGEYQKQMNESGMNAAKMREHNLNAAQKANEMAGSVFGAIGANPSLDTVKQGLTHLISNGALPEDKAQAIWSQYEQAQTPEMIKKLADIHHRSSIPAKDQIAKYETRNTGGNTETLQIDPISGKVSVVNSVANTQSPDSAASIAATALQGEKNRGQAERHFQQNQNTPQYMETDSGLVALPKKLGAGQVPTGVPVMGPDGQPLSKPLKQVPASVNTAIIANSQAKNQLDRALKLLSGENIGNPAEGGMQGDKAATGWKGMLPQAILNRVDPSGVATRAEIADIGSLKLHDRSGAAVTASESPRLMPFIPTASDDAATVKKKLERLKLEIDNESKAMGEFYGKDQGYRAPPTLGSGSPAKPTSKTVNFGDLK
jgi:hypothetical protein